MTNPDALAILQSFLVSWSPNPTPLETHYRSLGFMRTASTVFSHSLITNAQQRILATQLAQAFDAKNNPRSTLSVGARALSKHYERREAFFKSSNSDVSSSNSNSSNNSISGIFDTADAKEEKLHPHWSRPTGTDADKNGMARAHLIHLLELFDRKGNEESRRALCWKNIHLIHPNDTCIIEIRDRATLHGMRWTVFFERVGVDGERDLDGEYRLEFRGFLEP
ncbi:hypothetical protein BJ741DRAFT_615471 [Chytriomyces cf. hyalinus JEL632]|nr:hypothetical protein BJ741DRAFT_615471 [Chytriomyces cf. hyalinus JEL632]